MTEPTEMLAWIDRRIASAMTWLDNFGKGSKKARPDHEIETKLYDIARFEEVKVAYVKALERKRASEVAA
jgi:hypothetical protein